MYGSNLSGRSKFPAYNIDKTVMGISDGGAQEERASETELALGFSVPESSFFMSDSAIGVEALERPKTFAHSKSAVSFRIAGSL